MSNLNTGEISVSELESSFRSMSLRKLSFETAQIAELIEESEPDQLLEELQGYLAQATEAKIDGYVLYKQYLDAEIETWKAKREALIEMCVLALRVPLAPDHFCQKIPTQSPQRKSAISA